MHIAYTVKIYLLILIISLFDVGRPSIYSTTLANLLDFYRSFHLLFAFISKYVLYRTVILRIYLSHPVLRPSVRPSAPHPSSSAMRRRRWSRLRMAATARRSHFPSVVPLSLSLPLPLSPSSRNRDSVCPSVLSLPRTDTRTVRRRRRCLNSCLDTCHADPTSGDPSGICLSTKLI